MTPQSVVPHQSPRATRARWPLAALLAVTTLAACKQDKTPASPSAPAEQGSGSTSTPTGAPSAPGTAAGGTATGPGTQPAATPPSPESLTPVIRELAPEGLLPEAVVIEFPRAVMPSEGDVKPGTTVDITPRPQGSLSWTTPSTLTFRPSAPGFSPNTKYTVTVGSVWTPAGEVKPPSDGSWSYRFTTPAFRFVRLSPRQLDLPKGRVEVDVVFSGPVELAAVRSRGAFQVEGQAITEVKWSTIATARNVLTAQLTHPRLKPTATVRFALTEGLSAAAEGKATAPAAEATFALRDSKRLDVTGVFLKEGATGHYLEVSCRDSAPGAPAVAREFQEYDSYYWDDSNKGCMLDDAVAADAIHLTPPVKFTLTPSRRGFRLFGDFKRGPHALRIDAGTASVGGGTLLAPFAHAFSVPARKPQVSFASSGRYLPRSAWRNLPLQHLNLDEVELTVRNVPPENLVFWMGDDNTETVDERTSNVVAKRKLALKSAPDTLATTYVDVATLVPATTRGLVELSATSGEWRASTRILLTDLSLVAKRGGPAPGATDRGEVWVWALGMESTEPLSGVEVSLVKKSGQSVARCTTVGAEGCVLKVPPPGVDDSEPFALIARDGEELTYLKYSELKTEIANSDVQGEPYRGEKPYRASLWSDRGVYRPGDTAHVVAVLRAQDDVAPPVGMPVELVVVDPRERELRKVTLKTNEAGLVSLDVPFEAFQDTGRYRVTLKVADRDVASYGLSVEEFVPERMKVTARAEKEGYVQGEEVPVGVEAAYLFGGSAEGSPVELTCRLVPSEFKPKENAQYAYGVWRQGGAEPRPTTLGQVKGTLDAKGQALLRCPAQANTGGFRGAARLTALASVFESGSGRSTVGDASTQVHPEPYYVGLQANTRKVKAGKPFTVQGVVVDWDGKLVTGGGAGGKAPKSVDVEYVRLEEEYGYFYDEVEGYERYQRHLRPLREGRVTVPVKDGRFSVDVTPGEDAAGYLVRVRSGATQTDLELEGEGRYYWWGEGNRVDQTPRPLKPASLNVVLPASARVGQPVAVTLKVPYKGRLLLTAETDRVLTSEWKAVEPGEVTWSFKPAGFAPNVYVSAFLVKDPHLESKEAFMPDRAFGVASVTLEPVDYTQAVTMNVPKEVRSNDTLTVELDLGAVEGPTFATVAVVDEGILSLTRFQSPDPLKQLFTKRALGVDTYETIGWTLLVPPGGNSRSTGGDGEGDSAGRVQPVKPVALWSGVVAVPANGKLRVPFKLPQYRGAVRVMAVTAGKQRIGRASAQVLVRDPLVLQATLPRFLTQNDEIQVPVFVTNLSGKAQDVKVTLATESLPVPGLAQPATVGSPVQLLGKSEGRVRLEDGKSTTFVFQARAVQAVGAARMTVTVEGGGHTSRETLDVPLTPAGPRERRVQRVELAQGTTDLSKLLQGWVPTTERTTLWVTTNPYAQSLQHLSYLVRYPYGCVEQTTSSTRPLLFVSELLDTVDPTLTQGKPVGDLVLAGINRVLSMQTSAGGFAYWPGHTEPVDWGTAYATHMLLDAQKLKYPVPQDRLDDALAWMGNMLNNYEGRTGRHGGYSESSEAYMHYVLALGGKGRKARVQKMVEALAEKAKKTPLVGEEREQDYMLKAALWLAGDRRYEKELKSPDLSPVTDERKNNWSFYSDKRRRGFMLSTFQDLFGNDAAGEPLAQLVAESLQTHSSSGYTTQELVWGISGLGKRLQGTASTFSAPVLTAEGKTVAPVQDKAARTSDRTWALARASERQGLNLEVKSKDAGKLYLIVSSEGVRTDGQVKSGGQGLTLTRRWRKLDGTELALGADPVALADLVYVELEVRNTTAGRVQNIALVDRLPAGWEIENARLGRGGAVSWVDADALWSADYVNIRDDRMEVFGSLNSGESKKVVYAVRAVTAGTFQLPSAEAEAMYDPRLWAREKPGTVRVSGPWKDNLL
ncbi:Ig-like domain-containing alpha-2-macroglobulin family protein [Pyxidicoccus xibeiensis]|uniref:Ig-like domain-containing alpha-2-macroglobulin family protein n=1 Tax=Pyxidicoccus xibeiensis TaxID=2906759 RepID=UPI0020A7EE61|nr:Ig-like domain-containing alpha-2-macroglobulin family protein [Pyxidicoccus xibeiensis]MCP3144722.1 MG2 domain-containing protein [Pyxidicoccus xibeiensis]